MQAAGLDAFLAGGLDAFLASYNCFYGWSGRFPGQLQLFFMDSKGDGKHFWNVLFSTRFGPVFMVVCRSAGGWFGRFPGQWFGRFPAQLQLFFMNSKGDGKHFWNVLGVCLWWFAVAQAAGLDAFLAGGLDAFLASYNCVFYEAFLKRIWKGNGKHFWNVLFSTRFGPVFMVVCRSAGGWFGRFPAQWFGRFPGQLRFLPSFVPWFLSSSFP